jgi:two-component system NtrC family sensor kinase
MSQEIKVLCVDDEENVLKSLRRVFMDENYEILTATSAEEGLATLEAEAPVPVIISDYRMPGMNGVDFLHKVYEQWPDTIRIVLSGYADTAAVVAAINEGQIYQFIPKPWDEDKLKETIDKALKIYFLHKENKELAQQLQETNKRLEDLNKNLSNLVEERTAELVFRNKALSVSQNILDALPIAVMGFDLNSTIVLCNIKSLNAFTCKGILIGSLAEDVLPKNLADLVASVTEADTLCTQQIAIAERNYTAKVCLMKESSGQEGKILVLDSVDD